MDKFFVSLLLFSLHADLTVCPLCFIVGIFTISRHGLLGFTILTDCGTPSATMLWKSSMSLASSSFFVYPLVHVRSIPGGPLP